MAVTKIQFGNGEVRKQPGQTLSSNKVGVAVLRVSYQGYETDIFASKVSNPDFNDFHPQFPLMFLTAKEFEWMEGDVMESSLTYEGIKQEEDQPNQPVFELIRSTSQEPIETHPDFVTVLGGIKGAVKHKAKFDSEGLFTGFPPDAGKAEYPSSPSKWLGGTSSYFAPNSTWRKTYITFSRPSSQRDIPSINAPAGAPSLLLRNANGTKTEANWLMMGRSWQQRGSIYEVQEEWLSSGFRGWNPLIYPTS